MKEAVTEPPSPSVTLASVTTTEVGLGARFGRSTKRPCSIPLMMTLPLGKNG